MTRVERKLLGLVRGWALLGALALAGALGLPAKAPAAGAARASAPVFSPRGGASATDLTLELAADSTDDVIHYTLDGSEPDATSAIYRAPFLLTNSVIVRAKTFSATLQPSAIASETYTLLDDDLLTFHSNLPLVIVNSFGASIEHESKVLAGVQIIDSAAARARLTSPPHFSGEALINTRGRASLRYPKLSYTVKFTDGDGESHPAAILGMPAESDWVLYAPFPDKTLMRDVLAYELSGRMGHWAPRTRFVEVFLNQAGTKLSRRDYVGVYVLEEKIKRDRNRVNLARLKPDDSSEPRVTGGYIFKKDHIGFGGGGPGGGDLGGFIGAGAPSTSSRTGFPTGPGGFPADPRGFLPTSRSGRSSSSISSSSSSRSSRSYRIVTNHLGHPAPPSAPRREASYRDDDGEEDFSFLPKDESFKTSRTNEFYFVEPEPDEITAVQKAWLKRHLDELEGALYGPDFADPERGYAAYLDPDSFIDYHLIVETTKNVDGFRFSVFFRKDRGGRIKADPIWDWNLSFGNANGKQGWIPENWLWPQLDDKECTWYRRLFDDPDFGQRYVDRWAQLRTNVLATATVLARVDELAALLAEAQQRNFQRWPILGRPVNPNYFVGATYAEEVNWMKKFIQTRLDWMEKQFPPVPKLTWRPGPNQAELSADGGEIFFTRDGADPRARGGSVAPTARPYEKPIPIGQGVKLIARGRQEGRWSGPAYLYGGD